MKQLFLVDKSNELITAWKKAFDGCVDVEVYQGDFFEKKTDCIVSPANSYGFMDGGLDLAISKKIGWELQKKVRERIISEYDGELLVGQAILFNTDFEEIPYCIVAPTMRVPMILTNTVNVYLATKAIFKIFKNSNINSLTISGLGTGVGKVTPEICAQQMKKAYDDIWLNKINHPITWYEAQINHQKLYTKEIFDIQHKS